MSTRRCTLRGIRAAALTALLFVCAQSVSAQNPAATDVREPAGPLPGPPIGQLPEVNTGASPSPVAIAPPSISPGVSGAPPTASPGTSPGTPQAAPTEDIRDIRGPKYILPAWLIPAVIAALVLLGVAAYGAWRWYRRRQRPRVLTLSELTLQRLEALRSLMQPTSAREFTIAISDIVRGYIEQRFDVTATHRTTEEFLHDLLGTSKPSLARHRGLLEEFLQQCDLVKFGGMSLSVRRIEALHQSARTFVLETAKPDEAAPTQGDTAVTANSTDVAALTAAASAATAITAATVVTAATTATAARQPNRP